MGTVTSALAAPFDGPWPLEGHRTVGQADREEMLAALKLICDRLDRGDPKAAFRIADRIVAKMEGTD